MSNDSIFSELKTSLEEATSIASGESKPANITRYEVADVEAIREQLKLSRKEFGEGLDVSAATVKSWELRTRNPTGLTRKVLTLLRDDPDFFHKLSSI